MENEVEQIQIARLTREGRSRMDDVVVREFALTIILNDQELVTLLCTPQYLDYLAVGYLASEGLLQDRQEIKRVTVDDQRGVARVETMRQRSPAEEIVFKRLITSGCGRGASFYSAADIATQKVESEMKVSADEIFDLVNRFQHGSELYRATGGVHSAALCDRQNVLVFSEDIGRHNAIDKIFGKCLLEDIPTQDRLVITSGRISSEIMHKVAKRSVPFLISVSAPTSFGVKLADSLGITLIGHVRGKRMNIYTHDWRVV
ncbi:MAG: formate dehydrogenase accessory sulfurtransferase FdhD [Chloroflexi bacterium]|nr:formate dehydrogenase accessory sulfurtransferase FdhD [Chloroflexota bacterium]